MYWIGDGFDDDAILYTSGHRQVGWVTFNFGSQRYECWDFSAGSEPFSSALTLPEAQSRLEQQYRRQSQNLPNNANTISTTITTPNIPEG